MLKLRTDVEKWGSGLISDKLWMYAGLWWRCDRDFEIRPPIIISQVGWVQWEFFLRVRW